MTLLKVLTRLWAVVWKELIEVIRRPGSLISLVFGPFLIMLVFGAGYSGVRPPLRAVIVVPPGSGLESTVQEASGLAPPTVKIVAIVDTADKGRQLLSAGETDVLVIPPSDPVGTFRAGRRSSIEVDYNTVDPVQAGYAVIAGSEIVTAVNREVIRRAVEEGQSIAVGNGAGGVTTVPPDVVAAPTQADPRNLSPTEPRILSFFGPAMAVLVLQHMALTLVALSLVRERTSGQMDRYRISPVSATEIILGKLIAFGLLVGVVGAIMISMLVTLLGVPLLASPLLVAGVVGLLILASTAVGLLFGAISDSERQAVQLSLLALLAAVFFGGLIVPVSQMAQPAAALAQFIPVAHAMPALQNLMLTGTANLVMPVAGLVGIAIVGGGLTWLLLRRAMAPA